MDKLQFFLDKIHDVGIKKAEEEANLIIKKAEEEANLIIKKAEEKAKHNKNQADSTIRQITRDIVIALEDDITKRLKKCVHESVCNEMDVDFMKDILNKIIGVYSKSKEEESIDLSVVFSPNDVNKMIDFFMYRLKKDFQVNPEILESEDINSGLKINFKGDNFYLDYSSNTLTEIICNFIEPKLSDIIKNN